MGIADKLKKRINEVEPTAASHLGPAKTTGAQMVMESGFRARVEAAESETSTLRQEVQRLAGESASKDLLIERLAKESRLGEPVMLDPAAVQPSRIYNRSAASVDPKRSPEFALLLRQIAATSGNIQAGLVRRAGEGVFEVVFGARRLAACRTLGLPFRAMVADISDAELIRFRIAENLGRQNPSTWSLSRQIATAQSLASEEDRDTVLLDFGFSRQHLWRHARISSLPLDLEEVHPDIDAVSVRQLMAMAEYQEKQPDAFKRAMAACRTGTLTPAEATHLLTGTNTPTKARTKNHLAIKRNGIALSLRCSPEQAEVLAARIRGLTRELGIDLEVAGTPDAL